MVQRNSRLNPRQVEVLQWIADGCPSGVMKGHSHKTTAVALRNRRLITLSRKGGVWRAASTDSGIHYLRHGNYPAAEGGVLTAAVAARQAPDRPTRRGTRQVVRRGVPLGCLETRQIPRPPAPTEQLIADLVSNGGELRVDPPHRAKYEARVAAAIRFGKVPEGKQLVTKGSRWSATYVIRLEDAPAWLNALLDPLEVPRVLRRPHPVVVSLQGPHSSLGIDGSGSRRALLLIQALVIEASRRGYLVKETTVTHSGNGFRYRESKDHFAIVIDGHAVGVQVRQIVDRIPHTPTPAELARAARDSWFRIPKHDLKPSERLSIHLSGGVEHRQSKWTDSSTQRLDDLLPQVLQEIELRADEAERAKLAAIEAEKIRRRRWELAMAKAKRDHREAHRDQVLENQMDDWLRARRIGEYLDAMRSAIATINIPEDARSAREWFEWAERRALMLDPLQRRLEMPAVPEPAAEDLKPFLDGWSPYGPDKAFGW